MALLLVLRTRNNTIGDKLVVFPCITLYYGDIYLYIIDFRKLVTQEVVEGPRPLIG